MFAAIQTAAPSLRVDISPVNMREAEEIERAVAAFAHASNGGLVVTPSGPADFHRDLIITLAARHKLPTVYFERAFVEAGGLISYGTNQIDQYQRAAGYVIASSRARSRPTFRCRRRPSMSWSSTSRPRGRSASKCPRHFSPAPTR